MQPDVKRNDLKVPSPNPLPAGEGLRRGCLDGKGADRRMLLGSAVNWQDKSSASMIRPDRRAGPEDSRAPAATSRSLRMWGHASAAKDRARACRSMSTMIRNFGRNLKFRAEELAVPRDEAELLALLDRSRGRKIRAIGRLHSWSEAPVGEELVLDLHHFDEVKIERRAEGAFVTAGAGCQIKRLLGELARSGLTLPAMGLVTEQTIGGAVSTATHGAGRSSMSHYVAEARVARYDPATGRAMIVTIPGGAELQAARCSLGALGILASVSFWARPEYHIEEHFEAHDSLEQALAREAEYPIQQFYLMPWSWRYFAQHRRESAAPRSRLAALYRAYFFTTFDVGLHLAILGAVRLLSSRRAARFFLRQIAPRTVVRNWRVVDRSRAMLIMEHELFRHIEIEIFVKRSHLGEAMATVRRLVEHCDDHEWSGSAMLHDEVDQLGLSKELAAAAGAYTHHYPICVRKVLPDATLISPTADAVEPWYALSFISYAHPADRDGFLAFARLAARALGALYGARLHWGKVNPLTREEIERLYPCLAEFREIRARADPDGVFLNAWTERFL